MVAVIFFSIMLIISFAVYVTFTIKAGDHADIFPVFILVILSLITGCVIVSAVVPSVSDYLKTPDSYQVDTFMVNGILDHYKVSNK